MGLDEELATQAHIPYTLIGGLCLLDFSALQQLLPICLDKRIAVLGIEGFLVSGEHTRPDLDAMADFSGHHDQGWEAYARSTILATQQFLQSLTPEQRTSLRFEVCLDSQE